MRGFRIVALTVTLALGLAACFGGSSSRTQTYGISWRMDQPETFEAASHPVWLIPLLEQTVQAQLDYVDSEVASGYWIPDPVDPLGMIVGLQAWTQEDGNRRPTAATWSVIPEGGGEFSRQNAAETHFRPTRPGKYTIHAAIGDAVVSQQVEIYGGFVLDTGGTVAHGGGTGFRFDFEEYEEDHGQADIYIDPDGTVRIPGGFVYRSEQYLHEVNGPVSMNGARTSFGFGDARLGIMVLETRNGQQVASHLGVTVRGTGYAYVFGYKVL